MASVATAADDGDQIVGVSVSRIGSGMLLVEWDLSEDLRIVRCYWGTQSEKAALMKERNIPLHAGASDVPSTHAFVCEDPDPDAQFLYFVLEDRMTNRQ